MKPALALTIAALAFLLVQPAPYISAPGQHPMRVWGGTLGRHKYTLTSYEKVVFQTDAGRVLVYYNQADQLVLHHYDRKIVADPQQSGNMLFLNFVRD